MTQDLVSKLLNIIVDSLDIPKSYYIKAVERHKSVGEWLCRPESKLAIFNPSVHSQGSFRYGTVVRPLLATAEYDLDNVTTLEISKTTFSQKQLKQLYGAEVIAYAKARGMIAPIEKNRCWRLRYSDEASFHLDALPCIIEEENVIQAIITRGVPPEWARLAVAITDKRHPEYDRITRALLTSNPRGFARWFEQRVRPWALSHIRSLVDQRLYASVQEVPPYEWKTPLQRSIQLLKRHRDVMFLSNPAVAPISMIITNLATHAYAGETDLWAALTTIVREMPKFVNQSRPRVPNPADPAEDYADKWAKNPVLEENFWSWHTQLRVDLERLSSILTGDRISTEVRRIFSIGLTQDELKQFERSVPVARVARTAATISIPTAPKPWGKHA
jgi:hypothetical protein